jgi:hypothetical protein
MSNHALRDMPEPPTPELIDWRKKRREWPFIDECDRRQPGPRTRRLIFGRSAGGAVTLAGVVT